MEKIDFVVLWVDGSDPLWRAERAKFEPEGKGGSISEVRYRDWDMMRYWFRGVERFAPWVNHIYFVTCGHYPAWLNLQHPKLTLVKHSDFIPQEYLPTFNSNTILLNIHRIPGLSRQFVVFNDDMFLIKPVQPTAFFRNGLPCETAVMGQLSPLEWKPWTVSVLNNILLINRHFRKKDVLRKHFRKFYSVRYGKYLLQNIVFRGSPYFSNFRDPHLPASYLKETFQQVWEAEPEILHGCCRNKFRSREDVTEWLMKYWQLCSGQFTPRSIRWGKYYSLASTRKWSRDIRRHRYNAVCLNDTENLDVPLTRQCLQAVFTELLPQPSEFEGTPQSRLMTQRKPLITVVIPIYMTEKYLDRCVESVVGQTYSALEILLIDDGSPDRCPQICDEWAQRDSRIRVIHKENAGLGLARNTGIENASGEYICFFDSDDYVAPDTIEKAYQCAEDTGAEAVSFGYYDEDCNGKITKCFVPAMEKPVYEGTAVQTDFLPELVFADPRGKTETRLWMSACMMLFSMERIRSCGWRFVSERDIISEDVYSLLHLFGYVQRVAVLPEALYYYCENGASISRAYKQGRYERVRHFYLESLALCRKMGYTEEVAFRVTGPYLAYTRATIKQEAAAPVSVKQRKKTIRQILGDETLQNTLQQLGTDEASRSRKAFFFAMKNKMSGLCYLFSVMKNRQQNRKKRRAPEARREMRSKG